MRRIAVLLLLAACAGNDQPRAATPPSNIAPAPAVAPPDPTAELPMPDEPWYRDQPKRDEECVAPLAQVPPQHFPAPFEACDPHVESFSSPPGGPELHFHYRHFSPALTRAHRASSPTTCCYMIFEFTRRHR